MLRSGSGIWQNVLVEIKISRSRLLSTTFSPSWNRCSTVQMTLWVSSFSSTSYIHTPRAPCFFVSHFCSLVELNLKTAWWRRLIKLNWVMFILRLIECWITTRNVMKSESRLYIQHLQREIGNFRETENRAELRKRVFYLILDIELL